MNDENLKQKALHKEIELVQSSITKMKNYSIIMKVLTAMIIIAGLSIEWDNLIREENILFIFMIMISIVALWVLDTYFLNIKMRFENMYNWVLENRKNDNLDYQYDLNHSRFEKQDEPFKKLIFSKPHMYYYIVLLVVTFIPFIFSMAEFKF